DAKRLKELEKGNAELKKCWPNRCSKIAFWKRSTQKSGTPDAEEASRSPRGGSRAVLGASACCYLDVHRSTYRYQAKPVPSRQAQLHQRIVALSWHHPRYGYRRIRALLAQEGWSVSRKQVQRI
ncbi:MAG: IS3 family transposase, partial [Candidatus Latescibacterota bacterium]|nr:IS3 family transposase [Candidatus Latescibacterota bacterium]